MDQGASAAAASLGAWVAGLRWEEVPSSVRERLRLVLLDVLAVTTLGAQEPAQRALVEAWEPVAGPVPLFGTGRTATVETAAWLNATALVRLELDEGNKYAKGHPAAHGFPAVLALAAARGAPGFETLTALLAAYEVASRFGRATRLRKGMHPHGSWGVAGAAAGCARLLGSSGEDIAAAIDAGSGMPIAGPFISALDGNQVRDAWVGAANLSGLAAARMARAGLASNTGTAADSLGALLGEFDPTVAKVELGTRWDIELGYFKQHAACSYTHPAADAMIALRQEGRLLDPATIRAVVVETHALAAGLDRHQWSNRLSAMFSLPFVVSAAALHGEVRPDGPGASLDDPALKRLAERVEVRLAPDLDARLPDERPVRLTVVTDDGPVVLERPNPVGDSAYLPFDEPALRVLLAGLLASTTAVDRITGVIDRLYSDEPASILALLSERPGQSPETTRP